MADDKLKLDLPKLGYAAGETVSGTVTALSDLKARTLKVTLGYCDASADYSGIASAAEVVIHEGPLTADLEIPFSVTLPADARPAIESAHGKVYWAVRVDADIAGGRDAGGRAILDVTPDPAAGLPEGGSATLTATTPSDRSPWAFLTLPLIGGAVYGFSQGSAAIGAACLGVLGLVLLATYLAERSGKKKAHGWDITATVPNAAARRGDSLDAELTVGRPAEGRMVEMKLVCEEHYDYRDSDEDGDTRRTAVETAYQDVNAVRVSSAQQTVSFQVPAEAPFTYAGNAVSYRWKLAMTENVDGADPLAEAEVTVAP